MLSSTISCLFFKSASTNTLAIFFSKTPGSSSAQDTDHIIVCTPVPSSLDNVSFTWSFLLPYSHLYLRAFWGWYSLAHNNIKYSISRKQNNEVVFDLLLPFTPIGGHDRIRQLLSEAGQKILTYKAKKCFPDIDLKLIMDANEEHNRVLFLGENFCDLYFVFEV